MNPAHPLPSYPDPAELAGASWFKATVSNGTEGCVEVAHLERWTVVRDSKDPGGPVDPRYTRTNGPASWTAHEQANSTAPDCRAAARARHASAAPGHSRQRCRSACRPLPRASCRARPADHVGSQVSGSTLDCWRILPLGSGG